MGWCRFFLIIVNGNLESGVMDSTSHKPSAAETARATLPWGVFDAAGKLRGQLESESEAHFYVRGRGHMHGGSYRHMDASELPVVRLACCICGDGLRGRQWRNLEAGRGICGECAAQEFVRNTAAEMERSYGVGGVHYAVDTGELRRGVVQIDGIEATFAVLIEANEWNGFVRPLFDRIQALRLAELHNASGFADNGFLQLEPTAAKWIPVTPDDEASVWRAQMVAFGSERLMVWPIGAGGWCWSEVEGEQ